MHTFYNTIKHIFMGLVFLLPSKAEGMNALKAFSVAISNAPDLYRAARTADQMMDKHAPTLAQITQLAQNAFAGISSSNVGSRTPLHEAVLKENLEEIKKLINSGTQKSSKDADGNTALHLAAFQGFYKSFEYLVDRNTDSIDSINNAGATAFHCAALSKQQVKESLETLAALGAKIDVLDKKKHTALHYAAYAGNVKAIHLLKGLRKISAVLDVMPIHCAALNGHVDGIQALAELGMPIECIDEEGQTPLHYAAQGGHVQAMQFLIENLHARPDVIDFKGKTALHTAIENEKAETGKIIELLAHYQSLITLKDAMGKTAFHYAIERQSSGLVKCFLKIGKNLALNKPGEKADFQVAIEEGCLKIVKLFLEHDAPCEQMVHWAAGANQVLVMCTLIDALMEEQNKIPLMDEHVKPLSGKLASSAADSNASPTVGEKERIMMRLGRLKGNKKFITIIERADAQGKTPLHWAAASGSAHAIHSLLSLGARPTVLSHDGQTPLHLAAIFGRTHIISLLLADMHDQGVIENDLHSIQLSESKLLMQEELPLIDVCDNNKQTALHLAVINRHGDSVKKLVALGARLDMRDKNGETPFGYSIKDVLIAHYLYNVGGLKGNGGCCVLL